MYSWRLVQQSLLWHHSGCYTCYQGETIRLHDPKMCTCNHAVTRGVLGQIWAFKLTVFVDSALIWFHHDRIEIDTSISVIVVSLTTWEAHHSPRALPSGCGELLMSLMRQQWPQYWYQFLYHIRILMLNMVSHLCPNFNGGLADLHWSQNIPLKDH